MIEREREKAVGGLVLGAVVSFRQDTRRNRHKKALYNYRRFGEFDVLHRQNVEGRK